MSRPEQEQKLDCPNCHSTDEHEVSGCNWWTCVDCGCLWSEDERVDAIPTPPPASNPFGDVDERAEFEKWLVGNPPIPTNVTARDAFGAYKDNTVSWLWRCWQAALERGRT